LTLFIFRLVLVPVILVLVVDMMDKASTYI